jgi:hypothetical protein
MHVDSSGSLLSIIIDVDTSHHYGCSSECVQICGKQTDDAIYISGMFGVGSVSNQAGFLTKIDSSGNIAWFNYFYPDINTTVLGVTGNMVEDGSLIISGICYDSLPQQPFIYSVKYDTSGVLQWSNRSLDPNPGLYTSKAIKIAGSYYISSMSFGDTAHCFSISNNGAFQWHRIYDFGGNPNLFKTADSKILMSCIIMM